MNVEAVVGEVPTGASLPKHVPVTVGQGSRARAIGVALLTSDEEGVVTADIRINPGETNIIDVIRGDVKDLRLG